MLSGVDLSPQDQDVYRALLAHPSWTLADIRDHVGKPEREVRASFDRLTKLALLEPSPSGPGFVPVNPEVGLAPLLQQLEAELDERKAKLSQDQAIAAALVSEYTSHRVQTGIDGVERVDGLENVRQRLAELSQQSESDVRAFMTAGALSPSAVEACRPLDEETLARGVAMRTVYLDSVRNDRATVDYATWFTEQGGEARTVPALPMRLILCDRSVAVVPLQHDASGNGALVIRLDSVVAALYELFDLIWDRAVPLGETLVPETEGPSERDLALLKMLELGLTDEGMGRKLGVSVRTVRRLTADLLKRLDAQSRFQAGMEAARRGWV